MKILIVSDIHYRLQQFDWLVEVADRYDLVIIAGDLLDLGGHADLDAQIVVVTKYLHRIRAKTPLAVCSGNHDGDDKNEADEYICLWLKKARSENLYVDGDGYNVEDLLVSICPWWDGPVTRGEMEEFIKAENVRRPKTWLGVHHAPPNESPISWTGRKDAGDAFFRDFVNGYRPRFAFSGHIHNSPFKEEGSWIDLIGNTWVFNPGVQIGSVPSYIELELDGQVARWISLYGCEEVDLSKAVCERTEIV
jgi:Icc-related predicted phosphoesterase